MQKPTTPASEQRRLEVLRDYGILDTPPEAGFDALTRLAAQVCHTAMATISLVDADRQWFKSRVGLELAETTREASFCGKAILRDRPLVVSDASQDPRFSQSPLVTGPPGIRFYAGIPLVAPEGEAIGTLCVMDREPRVLRDHQLESLQQIARLVQMRLEELRQMRKADRRTQQTAHLARTVVELETEVLRRRRAEEESRRYADIVQNIQLGLLVWQLETPGDSSSFRLVASNPAASRATGMPLEALVGRTMREVFPKLLETELPQKCLDGITTGSAHDLGFITYEDERIPRRDLRTRLFPLTDQCVGVAFENVTDQRLAETAQLEVSARKAAILDSAPDAVVTIDHEGKVFEWNPAAERIFEYRRASVLGKELAPLVFTAESRDRFINSLQTLVQTGQSPLVGRRMEMTARRASGAEFPVEVSVTRVIRQGPPIFTGFLRDITERRQFEEALRASQALYSSLVESLPQSVFRKDLEYRFTFANTKFCSTVSRRLEDVIGHTDDDFFPPAQAESLRAQDRQVIRTSGTIEVVEEMDLPGIGRRHLQFIKAPICNALGAVVGLQGMFWDITERVQLEEQLRQAQKMETVGQLAGGVAHDFNNLLTVIQGHASMLLAAAKLQPNETVSLQQISLAAERAANLTRQLLAFSRKQMLQLTVLDLNELIRSLLEMLQRSIGENIDLQTHLEAGLPAVLADPLMLEQVLLNLAANARDAMPQGGQISISTSLVQLDPEAAAQQPEATPGPYVSLTIADTGAGIRAEHLPHIFEPFFTTKEVGKGTGLGLATVYGIVKQHRGWITVSSELHRGTVFRTYLPAAAAKPAAGKPAAAGTPATETPARGGRETILVVEDEPSLRPLVRNILEHNGYSVLEAQSGKAALGVWQLHRDRIDLLLTDMVMPDGVNGRDLALQLQAEKPSLKVLYTSGYSTDIVGVNFVLEEGVNFLPKPYAARKLAESVRSCLDSRPPASSP